MDVISYVLAKNKAKAYTDQQIAGLSKGMDYKGSTTFANLPTPSASNKGWLYTVTDKYNKEYVSNGTDWVDLGSELDNKQDTLTAGAGISIVGSTISVSYGQASGESF